MQTFEEIRQTYIEAWPRELRQISIPSHGVRLTLEEAEALGRSQMELWETWTQEPSEAMPNIDSIKDKLERAFELVDTPGFVKVGGRAPKDTMAFNQTWGRVRDVRQAVAMLLDISERVNDDLHLCVGNGYRPWIWIREWMEINPWEEFRCLVSDRRVQGISQYWYDKYCERIELHANELKRVITAFLDYEVCPNLHLDQAVVDLIVKSEDGRWKITLLEVNPYDSSLTNPCLLTWKAPDVHGRLVFKTSTGETACL